MILVGQIYLAYKDIPFTSPRLSVFRWAVFGIEIITFVMLLVIYFGSQDALSKENGFVQVYFPAEIVFKLIEAVWTIIKILQISKENRNSDDESMLLD